MPGPLALVGAGEFLPAMADVDRALLASTGRGRPRVVILPTAAFPDGPEVFERWAALGVGHFAPLGAEVEPVLVRDRTDAFDAAHVQAIGEADLVYLSGGQTRHLLDALHGTPVGDAIRDAHRRGAVVAGGSAGAIALGTRGFQRRRRLPWPLRWRPALGFVEAAVIADYDALPEAMRALVVLQAPRGVPVVGIDAGTALVGRDGGWQVHGLGRVTVWRGRHRTRHRAGESFRL